MTPGLIVPALFFTAVAAALVVFVSRTLISSLGSPSVWFDNWRFKQKQQKLLDFERQLQVGNLPLALRTISRALILEIPKNSTQMGITNNHNYKVLERLISLTEKRQLLAKELAAFEQLEQLLSERNELLLSYGATISTAQKINDKIEESQKKPNNWAISEYQKRVRNTQKDLLANRKNIEKEFAACLVILRKSKAKSNQTYH